MNAANDLYWNFVPAGRYLLIPFLRTKSQMSHTKIDQAKNYVKKDQKD